VQTVAVGTSITERPRTEQYVPNSGIRLPLRVPAKRALGQGCLIRGFGNRSLTSFHPILVHFRLVVAVLKRTPPVPVTEHAECSTVGRHRVEVEVAVDDLPKPFPLVWLHDREMQTAAPTTIRCPRKMAACRRLSWT